MFKQWILIKIHKQWYFLRKAKSTLMKELNDCTDTLCSKHGMDKSVGLMKI